MSDAKPVRPSIPIAESTCKEQTQPHSEILVRILGDPRIHDHRDGFLSCLQCGICTSGCPAARFTDYSPRNVALRAKEGDMTLLEDDSVWSCFYCYTCQSRCPRKNSVALINQVIRSMQVERGYGRKHVAIFAKWGQQFYDKGMGGTPHVFSQDIANAWGPKWQHFIAHRDQIREQLGLGTFLPSEATVQEVQTIMEATGFKDRLVSLGAWQQPCP